MTLKVTARTRAEELRRYLRRIDQSWTGEEHRNLLDIFVQLLPRSFRAERCGIFVVEPETGRIVSKTGTEISESEIVAPERQSVVGRVIASGEAAIENDLGAAPGFHKAVEIATGFRTRNLLCVPVRRDGDEVVIGAIQVLNRRSRGFDGEDLALLETVAMFLAQAIERERITQELRTVSRRLERDLSIHSCLCEEDDFVARSAAMRTVLQNARAIAELPVNVLILGENGTGKERIARLLHEHSRRGEGPFVPVNCASIPEGLVESELFGYEKGAFTGAVASKPGRFELADGGTLFLDEVGELPLDLQVKLLRVLQERSFERVGGIKPIAVNVRLVAATNRDLRAEAGAGGFRQDLYYRLAVVPIQLPPLRDRTEDIPLLTAHFLDYFNRRLGRQVTGLTPEAMRVLEGHTWPGNIRELENLMERSVLLCESEQIRVDDLPGLVPMVMGTADESELEGMPLKDYVRVHTAKLERARIAKALEAEGSNVTRAARRLGISRKSLQTKMKDYGLRDEF